MLTEISQMETQLAVLAADRNLAADNVAAAWVAGDLTSAAHHTLRANALGRELSAKTEAFQARLEDTISRLDWTVEMAQGQAYALEAAGDMAAARETTARGTAALQARETLVNRYSHRLGLDAELAVY